MHPSITGLPRPEARVRAARARTALSQCRLCAFRCGADRSHGPAGMCRSDAVSRVFHEGIEWAGEEGLVPTYVVSLSGCNMTCSFCLTGGPSQNGAAGKPLDAPQVGRRIRAAAPQLRSVTILGGEPSIHLDGALEIAAHIPRSLPLVWKTNAYSSAEGRKLLRGIPEVVLADYKFGNDACAIHLAGVPDYTATVRANLAWAARTSRLIVRHLVMPGHLECCFSEAAHWLASEMPETPLSLMSGYLPRFRAEADPVLGRTLRAEEWDHARESAVRLGLRLVPWVLLPGASPLLSRPDEIWIDRTGRICVDSGSAELIAALKRLAPEFVLRQ